jgi:hypothetical protein
LTIAGAAPRADQTSVRPARIAVACVAAAVALAALSLILPWATTYDPWAWIVWGREVAHLDLRTTAGPSWKPLPVLFTTAFAPAGPAAPALWLVVARAGGLLAIAAAYAVARRLAGAVAGVTAATALLLDVPFDRVVWLGDSEGLLVAAVLAAVERHCAGARRAAFVLGCVAALLRPEVWPFLALYGAWLGWRDPRARPLVFVATVVLAVLWFAPELWGSGQFWRSASRARDPATGAAAFAPDPALEVVRRARVMLVGPVKAAALAALLFALARWRTRTGRTTLVLAACAGLWLAIVAAMTAHGFSGNERYVMAPMAIVCTLAGVGVAYGAEVGVRLARRRRLAPRLLAGAGAALLAAGIVPYASATAQALGRQLATLEYQATLRSGMREAIAEVGGDARVRACGTPVTENYSVPMLAWYLDLHIAAVGLDPARRGVVFQARPTPNAAPDPRVRRGRGAPRAVLVAGPVRVFERC